MPNKSPKDVEMSDAAYAKSIIEEIWPLKLFGRGPVITATYRAVKDVERSLAREIKERRRRQWTERRVRSIVDDEEPRLERYEVADLERMAVKEGRDAYKRSIERAARIAAFLAHADEAFHSESIEAHVAIARQMAGAGTGLAAAGQDGASATPDRSGELASNFHRAGTGGE